MENTTWISFQISWRLYKNVRILKIGQHYICQTYERMITVAPFV